MTNSDKAPDLLPCPFCGDEAYIQKIGGYPHGFQAGCSNDNCSADLINHESYDLARKAWNTRNDQSLCDRLADALRHLQHNAKHSGANMGMALDVAKEALDEYEKIKASA